MGTTIPNTTALSWTTPVTIGSGGQVASADLNALNQDVAIIHARPWWTGWYTASPGTGGTIQLFNGSNWTSTSSTSGVQSIAPASGIFTPSVAGMYRITAAVSSAPISSAHFAVQIVAQSATTAVIIPGSTVSTDTTTGVIYTSTVSAFLPVGTGAPNIDGQSFTNFYIRVVTYAGSPVYSGTSSSGSTYTMPTYAMVEGPVASFGSY